MKALVSKTVRKVIALLLILLVSGTGNVFADVMYYVHTDHLGTPVVITDSTQKNVWQGNKQPFGKTDVSVNLIEFNVRFPGQYYDAESGLHYNYFRDYDPSLGRYVQSDPIGLEGGQNTYAYVDGNPVSFIDPLGLSKTGGKHANKSKPMRVGEFDKNSDPGKVEDAIREAERDGKKDHARNLKGLLKVIKRLKGFSPQGIIEDMMMEHCAMDPYDPACRILLPEPDLSCKNEAEEQESPWGTLSSLPGMSSPPPVEVIDLGSL